MSQDGDDSGGGGIQGVTLSYIVSKSAGWLVSQKWSLLLCGVVIVAFMIIRHFDSVSWTKKFVEAQERHSNELVQLAESRDREVKEHQRVAKTYEDALKVIEEHYLEQVSNIESTKAKRIDEILKRSNGSAHELAEQLAEVTGYEVFTPPDGTGTGDAGVTNK